MFVVVFFSTNLHTIHSRASPKDNNNNRFDIYTPNGLNRCSVRKYYFWSFINRSRTFQFKQDKSSNCAVKIRRITGRAFDLIQNKFRYFREREKIVRFISSLRFLKFFGLTFFSRFVRQVKLSVFRRKIKSILLSFFGHASTGRDDTSRVLFNWCPVRKK